VGGGEETEENKAPSMRKRTNRKRERRGVDSEEIRHIWNGDNALRGKRGEGLGTKS